MKKLIYFIASAFFLQVAACSDDNEEETLPDTNEQDVTGDPAFVSHIFAYEYGPGQHIAMLEKCPVDSIVGNNRNTILLGGWGGHIIVGFNHDVENKKGEDLIIYCKGSVSPEPGIIYVMSDDNRNGIPDDTWFEIKGSETGKEGYIKNYAVTYYRPATDSSNVSWKDNKGNHGELPESSSWWWHSNLDSIKYEGAKLPDAYFNSPQTNGQQYWATKQHLFSYGYAENGPAPDRTTENGFLAKDYDVELKGNRIELDSAINAQGSPAKLDRIRFVKIQTGVFQQAGWLGEISTEINGVADLHLLETNQ